MRPSSSRWRWPVHRRCTLKRRAPWSVSRVPSTRGRSASSVVRSCASRGTRAEAQATARALRDAGWNFSVGLGQINVGNFERLGLTVESAFEPCANLAAMQTVLAECFDRASGSASKAVDQFALRQALSCYYSGNFDTGFRHGYVRKVVVAARAVSTAQPKE